MFIVPDEVLEHLTCSYCDKYLSVGPVKVDSTQKRICGRCVKNGEIEAVSMYRFFGENAIFKCINRYDGCNQLLTYEEVIEHEKSCISDRYECPICDNIEEMPVYEFLLHFKKRHSQNFLKESRLKKMLNRLQPVNTFLYVKENVIFVISLECPMFTPTVVVLKTFYIVKNNKRYDIKQKYHIYIDDEKMFETQVTNCLPIQRRYVTTYNIANIVTNYNSSMEDSYLVIDFELSVPLTINQINLNNTKQYANDMRNTRFLFTEIGYEETVKKLGISLSACGKKLFIQDVQKNQLEIDISCLHCANVSANNIYITSDGKNRHLVCQWCAPVAKSDFVLLEHIKENGFNALSKYVKFSCIWDCGTNNYVYDIQKHEVNCLEMNKPRIKCPFSKCQFAGMFNIMRTHLDTEHEEMLFFNFMEIYQSYKTYPDYNILDLSDKTSFYFWVHPTVLLKCVITIYPDQTIKINVECVDKAIYVDNIKIVVFNKSVKNDNKYCLDFTNESDRIDLKLLPIRMHFII